MTCLQLIFIQYTSINQMKQLSEEVDIFLSYYLRLWPSDKVGFKVYVLPLLDLILVSDS